MDIIDRYDYLLLVNDFLFCLVRRHVCPVSNTDLAIVIICQVLFIAQQAVQVYPGGDLHLLAWKQKR